MGLLTLPLILGGFSKASSSTSVVEPTNLPRTAVVGLQRLANESAEGRSASQRLRAVAQKMTADLAAKQKDLPPATGAQEMQRLVQQSNADFANAQRQIQEELRAKMHAVVAEIAAARGFDVVLNADTIVWSATRLDITEEVLSKLDAASSATAGK